MDPEFHLEGTQYYMRSSAEKYKMLSMSKMGSKAMPWLRWLFASLSPWRPRFAPWSVHVKVVVDKVATGQVFL
jgi:hypothetical protein